MQRTRDEYAKLKCDPATGKKKKIKGIRLNFDTPEQRSDTTAAVDDNCDVGNVSTVLSPLGQQYAAAAQQEAAAAAAAEDCRTMTPEQRQRFQGLSLSGMLTSSVQ